MFEEETQVTSVADEEQEELEVSANQPRSVCESCEG